MYRRKQLRVRPLEETLTEPHLKARAQDLIQPLRTALNELGKQHAAAAPAVGVTTLR